MAWSNSTLNPNNKGGTTMFDFIAFKIHWPNMLVMNLVPLKLSSTIQQKFNICLWLINVGFVSHASNFIFNWIYGGSYNCFLYLYHCSDNMILAISVKQTTFERPGSKTWKQYTFTRLFILCNILLRNVRLKMQKE